MRRRKHTGFLWAYGTRESGGLASLSLGFLWWRKVKAHEIQQVGAFFRISPKSAFGKAGKTGG
jgi:hypothetical protein